MGTLVGCVFSVGLAASMKTSALAKPGLYWGYIGIIGYRLGLHRDNGKEYGNYQNRLYRDYRVDMGVILGEWKRKWKLLGL